MVPPSPSTVQELMNALAHRSPGSAPPVLLGFDASRHLSRARPGDVTPFIVDMPISEETMIGVAIGLARAGRDVVVDLMFEGFLTRCLEPLLVGWPTAVALADVPMGRLAIRTLGAPVTFGGPSHSVDVLTSLTARDHVIVVHVASVEDVEWALTASMHKILLLADVSRPELVRGEVLARADGGIPLRLWRNNRADVVVCSHAELPAVVEEIESGQMPRADVLSSPLTVLLRGDLEEVLSAYENVDFRGVSIAGA